MIQQIFPEIFSDLNTEKNCDLKWRKGQQVHQEDKWRMKASFMNMCPLKVQEDWILAAPQLGILKHSLLEVEGRQT